MRKIVSWTRRVLAAGAFVLLAVFVPAAASWADTTGGAPGTGNVSASVSVNSTLTLALSANAFSFGSGNAGDSLTGTPGINATVSSNAPYALTVKGTDFDGSVIPASAMAVTTTGVGNANNNINTAAAQNLSETAATNLAASNTMSGMSGDEYDTNWTLKLPANAPSGSFTSSLTFTAVGQ